MSPQCLRRFLYSLGVSAVSPEISVFPRRFLYTLGVSTVSSEIFVFARRFLYTLGVSTVSPEIFVFARRFLYTLGVSAVSLEISVYALRSGNFCIRCVSGDVLDTCERSYPDNLVYDNVTVSIQSFPSDNFQNGGEFVCCVFADLALKSWQAQLCNTHALLTYPLRYPDT